MPTNLDSFDECGSDDSAFVAAESRKRLATRMSGVDPAASSNYANRDFFDSLLLYGLWLVAHKTLKLMAVRLRNAIWPERNKTI